MLDKFEIYIDSLKNKIDPKKLGVIMFAIFGAVVLFAMNMANVYGRQKQINNDSYNRAIYEVITSVNNIDILVAKVRITTSNEYNITIMAEIVKEAGKAKDNLALLPVDQNSMANVSKFFSQVEGYMNAKIESLAGNEKLTKEDHSNMKRINEVATKLKDTLDKIYTELNSGKLKWNEVEKVANKELSSEEDKLNLTNIQKLYTSLTDYEGLIYDGAFSNHITSLKPKLLTGNKVTVEQAAKKVRECVGAMWNKTQDKKEIEEVIYNGEIDGNLKLYSFEVKVKGQKDKIDVQITQDDGKLVMLISDRNVEKKNITSDRAKELGDAYLETLGLKNLEPTYYLETNNMITINYAAVQGTVVLYPDLIKVKIAMDTGEICSVECTGYIFNHYTRSDISPKITEEEARQVVSQDMVLKHVGLAIIPTKSKGEVLTYEFKGTIDNREFLIYINANTGVEENILLIHKYKNMV